MKYILHLWENIYIRATFLLSLFLLLFSWFYSHRFTIYHSFQKTFNGPLYDDIHSWGEGQYGFTENVAKSFEYYINGLQHLAEKAYESYELEVPSRLLKSNITSKSFQGSSWQNHLEVPVLEQTLLFLDELRKFCKEIKVEKNASEKWKSDKFISDKPKRYSKKLQYISQKDALELQKWLLKKDRDQFYLAMQKKPDVWPILSIREDIMISTCEPLKAVTLWHQAIEYIEYKIEKLIHANSGNAKLVEVDRQKLLTNVESALRKNVQYHKYLKVFYTRSLKVTSDIDWKVKETGNAFQITNDLDILKEYIRYLLLKCRVSGTMECGRIYKVLFSLKHKDLLFNSDYIYALAETAFRSGFYLKARQIIERSLKQKIYRDSVSRREARRLLYVIQLFKGE